MTNALNRDAGSFHWGHWHGWVSLEWLESPLRPSSVLAWPVPSSVLSWPVPHHRMLHRISSKEADGGSAQDP